MRIQKLVLKNFRSHEETVLELDQLNFIRGSNGSGKSSIQMALEYLFTGRCALTDAAGRWAEGLIRSGEKELEVSATLLDGETVCRRRTARSQSVEIDGRRVPIDVAEAFLSKKIGAADLLSAVLSVDRFVKQSAAEQQRLLARLLPAGHIDLPSDVRDALRALDEREPELTDVTDLEAAYKRYRDLAAEAARTLNALEPIEEPAASAELPAASEVEGKIQEFRREKELLMMQRDEEATRCWQTAQPHSPGHQTHQEEHHDLARPLEIRRELAELNVEQNGIETTLAALGNAKGDCPTCGQVVTVEAMAQRLQTLGDRRDEVEALIQGAREELNDCESSLPPGDPEPSQAHADERLQFPFVAGLGASGLESRLMIVTERIGKAERVLEKIRQNQSAKEKWEAHIRERARLDSRRVLFDKLVASFGPNGAAMEATRNAIRSLMARVNQHLSVFGYTCRVSFEPYDIRVSSAKDELHELSLKQLSESEQFSFGAAFQVAIAMTTGVRFVVIDRADALDTERRPMLTGLLMNGGLDQAIVLATGSDAPPALLPRGVRFLDLGGLPGPSEYGDGEVTGVRPSQPTANLGTSMA